jgi:MoaA/NifB/PqqE/SkfB family radical SAM enzyme
MMTATEFRSVAEKLTGVTGYLYYHLMGEPLTHPELPQMIAIASELGFKSQITTNGTLLASRGQALIEAGVHKVNISVHSFEEGSNEDYVNYINSCLDFADRASQAGIIVVLRLWNNGYDAGRNISTLDLARERFPWQWKEEPRATRIRDRLYLEQAERFEWPDLEAIDYGESGFCYGLKDQFGVLCDGTVVPCCLDSDGVLALGNLLETPLETILMSPRAAAIREGFSRRKAVEPLCRRCGYAQRFQK